ncbi:MAG: putative membrane protein [Crocinitomix sp.]|jgi:putative membrane protein
MDEKEKKSFLGIALRGIGMGAADVVPGVSGGTIAFITGIYEELLETISGLKLGLIKTWRKEGFMAMWREGNFRFLFALFTGILISIASLAVLIKYLLATFPIHLWAFFFGLIIASVWLVGKSVKQWNVRNIAGVVVGTVAAYFITTISPSQESNHLFYIFICGSIAICAMILPGISGSFILLLLGAYTTVLGAVSGLIDALKASNWDLVFSNGLMLCVFMLGCLIGLISFSRILNWLFKKAHDFTVAILTGFLIGSLNKIWPWKRILETFTKHEGEANQEIVPLVEQNIFPGAYPAFAEKYNLLKGTSIPEESFLGLSIALAILGIAVIVVLDIVGKPKKQA